MGMVCTIFDWDQCHQNLHINSGIRTNDAEDNTFDDLQKLFYKKVMHLDLSLCFSLIPQINKNNINKPTRENDN